jgi:hypothetical protein
LIFLVLPISNDCRVSFWEYWMTLHLYACLVMQIKSHVIISYYQNCHRIVLLHMNILAKRISTNRNRKLDSKFHSNCKKKSINAHKPYCFSSKFPVFIRLLVGTRLVEFSCLYLSSQSWLCIHGTRTLVTLDQQHVTVSDNC